MYKYVNNNTSVITLPGPGGGNATFTSGQGSFDPWFSSFLGEGQLTRVTVTPVPAPVPARTTAEKVSDFFNHTDLSATESALLQDLIEVIAAAAEDAVIVREAALAVRSEQVQTDSLADDAVTVGKLAISTTWSMFTPGASGEGTDALKGSIGGCDQTLDLTATEAAAALAVVDDLGTLVLLNATSGEGGYAVDYQPFPDAPQDGDGAFFGAAIPFCELQFLDSGVGTPATYNADSVAWKYWNGTVWSTLMAGHGLYDYTDSDDQDGDRPFQRNGAVVFIPPADWATTAVNGQTAYWIIAECTATVNFAVVPVFDDVEHFVVTPTDGFKCPETGTIVGCRLSDGITGAVHTTADIKFFLMNFTTGAHSDELTFPMDKRQDRWDGAAFVTGGLAVAADDILGVVITQPDGALELTNGCLELDVNL